MLSKITGFVSAESPLVSMPPFNKIYSHINNFKDVDSYSDILTNQLEKYFIGILYMGHITSM